MSTSRNDQSSRRRRAGVLGVGIALAATALGMVAPSDVEAARLATTPIAVCNAGMNKISVRHGVANTTGRTEYAGVSYRIEQWGYNSKTRRSEWRPYLTYSYVAKVFPSGSVELPPVHSVANGAYYRVVLAVSWMSGSQQRSWAGVVPTYLNEGAGTYVRNYCAV